MRSEDPIELLVFTEACIEAVPAWSNCLFHGAGLSQQDSMLSVSASYSPSIRQRHQ